MAPCAGVPLPHLPRDWAHPCHICAGTGLATATSAPGPGSPLPHLHRDRAHPCHICAGTGLPRAQVFTLDEIDAVFGTEGEAKHRPHALKFSEPFALSGRAAGLVITPCAAPLLARARTHTHTHTDTCTHRCQPCRALCAPRWWSIWSVVSCMFRVVSCLLYVACCMLPVACCVRCAPPA
jgi:hypothetical protein